MPSLQNLVYRTQINSSRYHRLLENPNHREIEIPQDMHCEHIDNFNKHPTTAGLKSIHLRGKQTKVDNLLRLQPFKIVSVT